MKISLDALEALARAATPGPWVIRKVDNYGLWQLGNQPHLPDDLPEEEFEDAWDAWSERDIPICEFGTETKPGEQTNRRNMAFVVATNPEIVLALIAQIRTLQADSGISPENAASHSVDEEQATDACRRGVTADCGCIDCRAFDDKLEAFREAKANASEAKAHTLGRTAGPWDCPEEERTLEGYVEAMLKHIKPKPDVCPPG